MNSAPVNMGVQIPLQDTGFVFFRYISKSEVAGLYGSSIIDFFRNLILFFIVSVPVYIPTSNARAFPFSTSS